MRMQTSNRCRVLGLTGFLVLMLASLGWAATTVTLEQPVYFVSASGDPVHLEPGTYDLDLADSWLRVGTGQPEDALLLQASILEHTFTLEEPSALSVPGEDPDQHHLVLLLPDGKQVEAIGSYSGVMERGKKRKFSSPRQALEYAMKMHKQRHVTTKPRPAPTQRPVPNKAVVPPSKSPVAAATPIPGPASTPTAGVQATKNVKIALISIWTENGGVLVQTNPRPNIAGLNCKNDYWLVLDKSLAGYTPMLSMLLTAQAANLTVTVEAVGSGGNHCQLRRVITQSN